MRVDGQLATSLNTAKHPPLHLCSRWVPLRLAGQFPIRSEWTPQS
ncbi:hypothetical protein [Spirosoma terrae]|nr:hypothetical protein [Spirosoma terrae]